MSLFYHGKDVSDKWFWPVSAPDVKTAAEVWWPEALASWRRRVGGGLPGLALARADVLERIGPAAPAGVTVMERRACNVLVWLGPLPDEDQERGEAWVQGRLT